MVLFNFGRFHEEDERKEVNRRKGSGVVVHSQLIVHRTLIFTSLLIGTRLTTSNDDRSIFVLLARSVEIEITLVILSTRTSPSYSSLLTMYQPLNNIPAGLDLDFNAHFSFDFSLASFL